MNLREAWHLSRIPYREVVYRSLAEERGRMWWGAFGGLRPRGEAEGDQELTNRALRIAKFDKLIVAVFNMVVAVIPFTALSPGFLPLALTSSVSLSLAATFGLTTLYAIQTLSSFVSTESSTLLSTMPLAKDDISLITLFSFIRSVDYMAAGSTLSQVILVAYLTASPTATFLMLAASLMSDVFAVTIALWFSRMFNRNLLRGGRSKGNTVLRLSFILMWGSLLMGVGFLLAAPWCIMPPLEKTLFSLNQTANTFFSILYPFSAGIAIANLAYPSAAFSTAFTASVAMIGYSMLMGVAGKWSLETVRRISEGTGAKIDRVAAGDYSIKTRNPLLGYVMKDLRVCSRNPATAFFLALPILETVTVSLMMTSYAILRASAILVATCTGGILALLMPLALLNAEGKGFEYAKTLPVNVNEIIISKTLISTATYVPVPLALLCLALTRPLTSSSPILIPFLTILAISSASIFEIRLFLSSAAKGRIAALALDFEKLMVGVMITLIPGVSYAIMYFISLDHILAILIMGGAAIAELAIASYLLRLS